MIKFKNVPLFIKLLIPVAVLFVVIGAILFVSKVNSEKLLSVQKDIAHNSIQRIDSVSTIIRDFQTIDGLFYRYLINQSTGDLENGEEKMAALKSDAIEIDRKFSRLLETLKEEERERYQKLQSEFKQNVIGLNDDGVYDVAIQMMGIDVGFVLKGIDGYTKTYNDYLDALLDLNEKIKTDANNLVQISQQNIEKTQFYSFVISGAVSILVVLGSIAIVVIIVNSIRAISDTTGMLAEGNNEVDIEPLERKDELGTIVESLKKFKENQLQVQKLTSEQEAMKHAQEQQRKKDMMALADQFDTQIGGLIDTMASASNTMQRTAETMQSIADETSNASQTVAASSEEASANVNNVAKAMEQMSAKSSEIAREISSARTKSNDAAVNAKTANDTVGNLNSLVENIGEVVVAIQGIAEQTNLLALNATIEAARAGEAGKGFAVVADEVKKLASETSKKTEEIGERIAEVQQATRNSVSAMERIIENVSEIDGSVTGVSGNVDEQNVTNQEIAQSISEASQGVQQVAQIIVEVQKGAGETGLSAQSVLTAARDVSELSENLKKSVQGFLNRIRQDQA